jgi:type I restriction enzyme S subunit
VAAHLVGAVQQHFNVGSARTLRLNLPPLAEQKAIASILGALDDKIELNRRMNATLEGMARALFQSWFVDFDPVRAKLDGRKPEGMDKSTAALFPDAFQESSLGPVPKGWQIIGLPEMIDFLEGPGLRNWQYREEGMKFLNIRCIGDGDLDIAKANCISLEEFENTYKHFALQADDIVISTSGTLGRLAIVRADHLPVMLNTSIIRMRGRGAVGLGYLWGFLQSEYFLAEMFALAAGSVQLNFGPMHLRQISILRPPDGILEGFERAVQLLLKKCLSLRKESRTLANLRDTLLPKLLSGELSVASIPKVKA